MRKYELMMILDPSMDKKDLDALIADIKKDISELDIKVAKEDVWGAKDMAYKIHGSASGYYLIYTLEVADPQGLKKLSIPFNIKKGLWRYLLTSAVEGDTKPAAKKAAKKEEAPAKEEADSEDKE